MKTRLSLRNALLLSGLLAACAHAQGKTFTCRDSTGRVTFSDTPCVVSNPASPAPPAPPCPLTPEQKQRAIREETQFLTRFPDEHAHRRQQIAELTAVVDKLRLAVARLDELRRERRRIDDELDFHRGTKVPPELQARADASDARFTASTHLFGNLEQEVAVIEVRSRCQRETFGKLWSGAAQGASACDRPACAPP